MDNSAPDATSESAALRMLDLPESRREWLRARLPSADVSGTRIYRASAVAALCRELLGTPGLANRGNVQLQTR